MAKRPKPLASLSPDVQARKHLRALFDREGLEGHIGICAKPRFSATWEPATADGIESSVQRALHLGSDVYVHVATHDLSLVGGRGSKASSKELVCLFVDFDLDTKPDKGKNYPSRQLIDEVLASLLIKPSMIVESGNGLHAYWLIDEILDAQEYAFLLAAWIQYIKSLLVDKTTGEQYDLDPVGDPARVLRVPGTEHTPSGKLVTLLECHPDRRYSIEQIIELAPYTAPEGYSVTSNDDINITLDPDAQPPEKKLSMLLAKRRFSDTWLGKRNDLPSASEHDMSVAIFAADADWSEQEIADLLIARRRNQGDELHLDNPGKYTRTIAKARSLVAQKRYSLEHKPNPIVEELNTKHAVVSVAGSAAILTEKNDPVSGHPTIEFSKESDLKLLYCNRSVPNPKGGEDITKAILWLEHPQRRQYDGIVFSPDQDVPGHFNLFRGFAVQPAAGSCDLILQHILEVICDSNEDAYCYVLNWLAHLLQKPAELPEVALVLRGGQGTGKNTLFRPLARILGQHYLEVSNIERLLGRFNSLTSDKLLILANEAVWGGDKKLEGQLKALITDPQSVVEQKYINAFRVRNYSRLAVASNEDWAVPVGFDDRRMLLLDVSGHRVGDHQYFMDLHNEIDGDGTRAFMHFLLNRDISGFNPRVRPSGSDPLEIKLRSADSVTRWWFDCLDNGGLSLDTSEMSGPTDIFGDWDQTPTKRRLYSSYRSYCKVRGARHVETHIGFTKKLNKLVTFQGETKQKEGDKRLHAIKLPALEAGRAEFLAKVSPDSRYTWSVDANPTKMSGKSSSVSHLRPSTRVRK